VLIFLGIPLAAGYLTRTYGERAWGRDWYETRFLPKIGPAALYGLLFTIVILFARQGDAITNRPWDVARIALPLLAYFALTANPRPGEPSSPGQGRGPGLRATALVPLPALVPAGVRGEGQMSPIVLGV
jgi:hypothetical protein